MYVSCESACFHEGGEIWYFGARYRHLKIPRDTVVVLREPGGGFGAIGAHTAFWRRGSHRPGVLAGALCGSLSVLDSQSLDAWVRQESLCNLTQASSFTRNQFRRAFNTWSLRAPSTVSTRNGERRL